jgi:AhpC/TSA antioxidant enzyme
VIAVRDHLDQLGDTLPVVITFTDDPTRLAAYRAHLDVHFPVVADVDRVLYRLFGAGRGSLRRVWSPGTLMMYARLLRRGRQLHRPMEDTRQLGADAVIDRDGLLHRLWLPPGPDARPHIEEIIDAVHELGPP